jgi:hypothetical protein
MPQFIVTAGAAIFSVVKGALTAQTIWGTIARAVAWTAVQAGIGQLIGGRQDSGQAGTPDSALPTSLRFQTDHPIEILYGQFATPGSAATPPLYYGDDNEYLERVILLNDFRSDSVVTIYGDEGEALTFAGDVTTGYRACTSHYQDEDGGDCLWVRIYLGDPGQTADPDLVSRHAEITTNFRLRGRTYAIVRMKADPKAFPSGEAALRFELKWSPAHDPRDGGSDPDDPSTWPWTDNPALIGAQYKAGYYLNGKLIGGMGWDRSRIPDADLISAANECDEDVALAAGGTEKRYRCGGSFLCGRNGRNHGQNLQPVLDAMDGDLDDGGGRSARFLPGVERAVVPFKLRWSDVVLEDLTFEPDLEPSDKINRIAGGFSDPDQLYEINDNLLRENATYLAEDQGQEFNADLTLIAVTSGTQGQRILKRRMEAARAEERLALSVPLFPYCQLERGDRLYLDAEFVSRLRLPDTPWRVSSRPAVTPDMRLVLALRRHPDTIGDWDETTDETDIHSISRTAPGLPVLSLSGVSVSAGSISNSFVALPVLKMSWTPASRSINVLVTITRLDGDGGSPVSPAEQDSRMFSGDAGEGYISAVPGAWYQVTYQLSGGGRVAPAVIAEASIQCTGSLTPSGVGGVDAGDVGDGVQRALAGLDGSGDLARDITSARANSSDLLRYTGGGNFTGALNATYGAAWGASLTGIPANLAALSGAEAVDNSLITLAGLGGGALAALDQVGNSQINGSDPIDYSNLVFPRQVNATDDSPIATSFGASYTELLRIAFDDFDENHTLNFAGSAFRFRTSGSGAADAECTITWKLIANDTAGSAGGNAQTLAEGYLSVVETAPSSGVFHATDDGTPGGTPLPGGPLSNWSNIRGFANIAAAQGAQIIVESQLFSWPLSTVYLSLWMKADSGATGYLNTGAGQCLLVCGGQGDLQNP